MKELFLEPGKNENCERGAIWETCGLRNTAQQGGTWGNETPTSLSSSPLPCLSTHLAQGLEGQGVWVMWSSQQRAASQGTEQSREGWVVDVEGREHPAQYFLLSFRPQSYCLNICISLS